MLSTVTGSVPVGPPLKPILKTSTVLGKRKLQDATFLPSDEITTTAASTDEDAFSQSQKVPRKRQRVEFDMDPVIFEFGPDSIRSVGDVKAEIQKALDGHATGDDEEYDILKQTLAGKDRLADDDFCDDADELPEKRRQELKVYMVALCSFAPHLGRANSGLVKSVLQCQWLGRDDQFAKIYTQLLAALASAQGSSYLTQIFTVLVGRFGDANSTAWSVDGFSSASRQVVQERLHRAIRYLLGLFPSAYSILGNLITSKFPYHEESPKIFMPYVNNLLKLREYVAPLKSDIVDLIMQRLLEIDMHFTLDLEDSEDPETAMALIALKSSQAKVEQEDHDSDESDNESDLSDEEDEEDDDESARVKTMSRSLQKLDSTMDLLFELHDPLFEDPDSDAAEDTFRSLMSLFSRVILHNHKSRYPQFLLFVMGQRSPTMIDLFCGTCSNIISDSQRPLVTRTAAVEYLSSFVSRGAKVSGAMVHAIFEVLGNKLEQLRNSHEPTCRGPDLRRYSLFYALTQALLYIFCFRWRDLIRSIPDDVDEDNPASYLDQDIDWEPEVEDVMRHAIYSKLNPLKVCSPVVVEMFARVAQRFRFLYIYPLIEANKRIRLSQFVSTAYTTGGALRESGLDLSNEGAQQLEAYFPFEPYTLPQSKRWVEADYLMWQDIPGLEPDESDDSDDDEVEVEDLVGIEDDTATDDEAGDD